MVLTTMKSAETFGGVAMHFDKLTACLEGTEAILCGLAAPERRFALANILRGDTDVFICLPVDVLEAQPQIARVLLGAMATAFMRSPQRVGHDTLFLVDEMPRLGRMAVLETIRDFGRKFGLFLWAIVQDLGQLEKAYGKAGVRSWLATPAVVQLFGVNELETAEMLSKRSGEFTAKQETESKSRSKSSGSSHSTSTSASENIQGTRTALISPDEIMSLTVDEDGLPEEQLLFVRGRRPLRCGLAKYYRRPEMAALVADNPFYKAPPKAKWRPKAKEVVAAIYAAGLLALSVAAVDVAPRLMVGDAVGVSGPFCELLYGYDGKAAFSVCPGTQLRLMDRPRRDGFVEVAGYGSRGAVVKGLIKAKALERLE